MFFDMDEAGQQALLRSAKLAFGKDMDVFVVSIEQGKDAADIAKEDSEKLKDSIEKSELAMKYFLRGIMKKYNKNNPQEKKRIVSETLDIISSFSSEIDRQHWIRELSQEMDIDEKVLHDMLSKISSEERRPLEKTKSSADEIITAQKRSDVLKQKIIGVILSDGKVWKKVANEYKDKFNEYFQDGEVKSVILSGEKYGYDFEKVEMESVSINNLLRKMYFENKYGFSRDESGLEVTSMDNEKTFYYYWKELEKELRKDQMKDLEREIKKAEENGNKQEIGTLQAEFVRIMNEIREIDQN